MTDQAIRIKNILARVKTVEDAEIIENILAQYETDFYRVKNDVSEKDLPLWLLDFTRDLDKEILKINLAELKAALAQMRRLRLGVAFQPRNEFISRVSEWVKKNVGHDVVVEFQRDSAIAGGARIYFVGKYYDGDLSIAADRVLEKYKERIIKRLFAGHGK